MDEIKFYKLKKIGKQPIYSECLITSLNDLISNIRENLAKCCYYKYVYNEQHDEPIGRNSYLKNIKEMSDDGLIEESINSSVVGINLVLPTIPKIIASNVGYFDEYSNSIDITNKIIDKIKNSLDIEEIKEFISTHNEHEIADKYCNDNKFIDMFYVL